MSPEFADEAALCLNANGIKAYIFPSLRPTPELSFALRELKCIAGIVITASHNPPEYNGYKVYWEDGAQITAPKDTLIIGEVKAVTDYNTVKTMDIDEARACGLYNVIGYDMDDKYIAALKKMSLNGDIIKTFQAANYTKRRWRALDESVYKRYSGLFDELESTGNTPLLMEYRAISELTGMGAVGIGSAAFDIDITQYESDGRSYIPVSAILIDGESIDNFSYGDKNIVLDEDTAGNVSKCALVYPKSI